MSDTIYGSPLLATVQKAVRDRPASISIQQLADDCGVSRVWVSYFLHGKAENARAVVLERIYFRCTGKQLVSHDTV